MKKLTKKVDTLKLTKVVPKKEAWLWKNKSAFKKLMEGLADAKQGRFNNVDQKS